MFNSELIRPYDIMIHGVKEYKQLAENQIIHSTKSHSTSGNSYIDSCFFTSLNPGKKMQSNNQNKFSFGGLPDVENEGPKLRATNLPEKSWAAKNRGSFEAFQELQEQEGQRIVEKENFVKGINQSIEGIKSYFNDPKQRDSRSHHTFSQAEEFDSVPRSVGRDQELKHHTFRDQEYNQYSQASVKEDVVPCDIEHYELSDKKFKCSEDDLANYNTVASLSERCFQTLKQIINIFVTDVMSEEDLETGAEECVVEEISGIIYHKSKILLKAITRKDKSKWFQQLMIKSPDKANEQYINQIIKSFDTLLLDYRLSNSADENQIQEICKMILKAPELTSQIGKLIAHIVSNLEEGEDKIKKTLDSSIKKNSSLIEANMTKKTAQVSNKEKLANEKKFNDLMAHLQDKEEDEDTFPQFQSFKNKFNPNSIIDEDMAEDEQTTEILKYETSGAEEMADDLYSDGEGFDYEDDENELGQLQDNKGIKHLRLENDDYC
jgi:hypothetical protein